MRCVQRLAPEFEKRLNRSEPYRWQDWLNTVGAPNVEPAAVLHFEQLIGIEDSR
jgi:hypothetical protein